MWKLVLVIIMLASPGEPKIVATDEPDEAQCQGLGKLFMGEVLKLDRKIVGFVCYRQDNGALYNGPTAPIPHDPIYMTPHDDGGEKR